MNQNPEQLARDRIDSQLTAAGWTIQSRKSINLAAATGVAVREYSNEVGPADYILFINRQPVGVIEAKREEEAVRLTTGEEQSAEYANARIKYFPESSKPFVYESTGEVTRFTDYRDPKPRSRPVLHFHRPEKLERWLQEGKTLRARLHDIRALQPYGLRDCQVTAIVNVERSVRGALPKAMVQMATGSGKTFTTITSIYRLLKFARADRILFLVNTKNLGEQAEQEFRKFEPQEDTRLFLELYGVTRLTSSYIPPDSRVYISTIQRPNFILMAAGLEEDDEEDSACVTRQKRQEAALAVAPQWINNNLRYETNGGFL